MVFCLSRLAGTQDKKAANSACKTSFTIIIVWFNGYSVFLFTPDLFLGYDFYVFWQSDLLYNNDDMCQ